MYQTEERGQPFTQEYSVYIRDEKGPISPLHDIPLFADDSKRVLNMVVEIPRWTNAKMEINLKETLNPIKQDVKKGKVRFVANCFPHHGYIWNYGALPQTWEDPGHVDEATGCKGDNDPIDALEIGSRVVKRGQVIQVKILGCVALIDEGETDWKIIVIDTQDPIASQVNDITDVETHFPGLITATIEWFKIYKIPDGKPENQFAFNNKAKDRDFAVNIVNEVHTFWKTLASKEVDGNGISLANTTLEGNASKISVEDAEALVQQQPAYSPAGELDSAVDKWHYVTLNKL